MNVLQTLESDAARTSWSALRLKTEEKAEIILWKTFREFGTAEFLQWISGHQKAN